jgi:hypothetical protein
MRAGYFQAETKRAALLAQLAGVILQLVALTGPASANDPADLNIQERTEQFFPNPPFEKLMLPPAEPDRARKARAPRKRDDAGDKDEKSGGEPSPR